MRTPKASLSAQDPVQSAQPAPLKPARAPRTPKPAQPPVPPPTTSQLAYEAARAKGDDEIEMWKRWNAGGRKKKDLEPLLNSLDNFIDREARQRTSGVGGSIPYAAMKSELRNAALKGLESYDPDKGAKLTTHVKNNFMRATGFVAANRNAGGYTPKHRVDKYQYFQNAKNELEETLGRPPTAEELATAAPDMKKTEIKRMLKEIRPEVYSGMGTEFQDGATLDAAKQRLRLYRSRLSEQEQRAADALFSGKYKTNAQAAKALGMSPVQLSKIKARIDEKIR